MLQPEDDFKIFASKGLLWPMSHQGCRLYFHVGHRNIDRNDMKQGENQTAICNKPVTSRS